MHVSVTALGGKPDRVRAAARDVVNYLEGASGGDRARDGSRSADLKSTSQISPGSYYSDSPESPGRWRGDGATGLGDVVDPDQLADVLQGRDPLSGRQLVQGQGSAGRARNNPKELEPGKPDDLIDIATAADVIGVDVSYLRRLAKDNATSRTPDTATPAPGSPPPSAPEPPPVPDKAYLQAEKVGGRWMVTRSEVQRFMAERRQPQVVMGYDVTFSAPKSLSIMWAAGDEQTRQLCEEAFEAGVARGVAYLEANAVWVRRGRGFEHATGMIAASYRHSTNRNLEPQLHEHVVIANMGTDATGRVSALDGRGLFAHATTAGYLAEAEMQHHCNRLGIAWTPTHRGIANVEGVPTQAIDAMSTRRQEVMSLAAELGVESASARQKAAVATRASKDTGVDLDDLRLQWRDRLADHGFGPEQLAEATSAQPVRPWTEADTEKLDRYLAGPEGVTEKKAIFDRRDVIQTIVDRTGGRLNADQIETHTDRWLHSQAAIPLTTQRTGETIGHVGKVTLSPDSRPYTTPTMIALEHAITTAYATGHDTGSAVVPAELVDAAIGQWEASTGHILGDDQADMVRALCGSGDQFQAAVGPAGTGKTTALEVAARAWETAGYRVIGAAVNGTAAEVLQRSTGIESRTVAELVTRLDTAGQPILDDRTVLLVDEASTLGNRQHARLVHHVQQAGAAMRTIGDPSQHGAVEAGGMWAQLVRVHPDRTPRLTHNRRQTADEMTDVRLANADYRNGLIADAIARLETNNRIVTAPTSGELLDQLAADWYVDQRTNPEATSRMIAEHHRERRALNQRAQTMLRADGTLTGTPTTIGEATFHIGDQVISRAPNRNLHPPGDRHAYIRNGTPGTITNITGPAGAKTLTVDFEHRGPIDVPAAWLTQQIRPGVIGGLTPAYAVTSHAAQGATYRTGRMITNDTSTREGVYVGLTRGTHDTRIYTVRTEAPTIETDPQLPRLPDPRTEIEALTDNLTKPRQTELATIAEPAIATILQLTQEPLAQLATSHHPLAPRAQTIVETRIAHQARHNPDPEIVNRIGPRPQTDSAAWDQAVESAAIYRERWNPDGPAIPPQPGVGQSRQQESQFAKAEARLDAAEHKFLASLPTDELAERRADLIAQARQLSNTKSPEQDRIISDISTRVDAIDRALAPRINEALAQPADYLTNTLGPRPAANPGRWDRAARTIETYRHATLGTEPDQGPLPNNPAIGPKPSDPLQAEGWQAAAQRIQALHSQPLRIAD